MADPRSVSSTSTSSELGDVTFNANLDKFLSISLFLLLSVYWDLHLSVDIVVSFLRLGSYRYGSVAQH